MPADTADLVSIIVPTINEAKNLPALTERTNAAMGGRPYELLIIDDASTDETPAVCQSLAERFPLRLIVRTGSKDGLSGAVLRGMAEAKGDIFVVMDADLQHPPEKIPELVAALEAGQGEFILGSRHVAGGAVEVDWGAFRRLNSWVATLLARPFAGRVKDPMSGFFAIRRSTFARGERLTPLGYKIGLELICKCRVDRVQEVPIRFGLRAGGDSKLSVKQQFRYLEHLSRLYDFCYPRLSPVLKFLIASAAGWIGGVVAIWLLLLAGVPIGFAPPIGYLVVIAVTALFHLRYVWAQRDFLLTRWPFRDFLLVSAAEWITCLVSSLWLAARSSNVTLLETILFTFGLAMAARYVLRKELLQDIRGLRRALRVDDVT